MNIQALLSDKVSQALIAAGAPADCEAQVRQSAKAQFGDYQANGVMAQIYRARLHSGEAVIVKVLRPGLEKTIQADVRLLRYLAETVEQQSPALARYRPVQMVQALATALNHELDLTHEGHNCEQVARRFSEQPEVKIPQIYWQWSSKRLLVQEFLPGIAPENPQQLAEAGLDGPLLAQRGAQAFMRMMVQPKGDEQIVTVSIREVGDDRHEICRGR